jgi:ribonuclease HI
MPETLNELLAELEVPANHWDLLLVGDGAGQGWLTHAGWAICLIDRIDGYRKLFSGCVNAGTVAWAEAAGALHALRWHYENHRRSIHSGPIEVVITTDNQTTARIGAGEYQASRNLDVWAGFDFFKSVNYHLNWKWVERNKNPLHIAVDKLSKNGRHHAEACALVDPYKLLP